MHNHRYNHLKDIEVVKDLVNEDSPRPEGLVVLIVNVTRTMPGVLARERLVKVSPLTVTLLLVRDTAVLAPSCI